MKSWSEKRIHLIDECGIPVEIVDSNWDYFLDHGDFFIKDSLYFDIDKDLSIEQKTNLYYFLEEEIKSDSKVSSLLQRLKRILYKGEWSELTPSNIAIQASAKGIALKYKIITMNNVISWADKIIMLSDKPDHNILDLSLSRTTNEIVAYLNRIGTSNEKEKISKILFNYFNEYIKSHKGYYQTIAHAIYEMVNDNYIPSPEAESEMWGFWDRLDLAVDGVFGDPDKVNDDLVKFIQKYMDHDINS